MNNLTELAQDFVEQCASQVKELVSQGREDDAAIAMRRGLDVANSLDEEGTETLYVTYWRYESESYGVAFEIEHGDPELMFGGVL